jgi:hypothetical protein
MSSNGVGIKLQTKQYSKWCWNQIYKQIKVSNQPAIDDKAKTNSQIESQTGL